MDLFKKAQEAAKKAALMYQGLTPIEMATHEATNNDPWGPHGKDMAELAKASMNSEDRRQIMGLLWKRIAEEKVELWRHTYKALAVFDYLIANGDMAVVEELRDNIDKLRALSSFQYKDPEGKDQGINVRHKSNLLVQLLGDNTKITETREKAVATRNKYSGVSSEDMRRNVNGGDSSSALAPSDSESEFNLRETGNKSSGSLEEVATPSAAPPKFRVQLNNAPGAAPRANVAATPAAMPVAPTAPLFDLLGGSPGPAAPAFAAPTFAAFGAPPPQPPPAAFAADFGAFAAPPPPPQQQMYAAPQQQPQQIFQAPVDPFAFQAGPMSGAGVQQQQQPMFPGGGVGMAPMGMRPAGLGAPQQPMGGAPAPKASLEDSLMANLSMLSMKPGAPAAGAQPKLGGW